MGRRPTPEAGQEIQDRVAALQSAMRAMAGPGPLSFLSREADRIDTKHPDHLTLVALSAVIGFPVRPDYTYVVRERLVDADSSNTWANRTFGELLRDALNSCGTHGGTALAKLIVRTGESQTSLTSDISRFLANQTRPKPKVLARILEALRVEAPLGVAMVRAAAREIERPRPNDKGHRVYEMYSIFIYLWTIQEKLDDQQRLEMFLGWARAQKEQPKDGPASS